MKQSVRKKMSLTKLTLARVRYIREHYIQFAAQPIRTRKDISNKTTMNRDTMVVEAGIEAFFKAICKAMDIPPEEADKAAIEEYARQQLEADRYVDRLTDFVELEYSTERRKNITPEDRKKAVDEYLSEKRNKEISDEWNE